MPVTEPAFLAEPTAAPSLLNCARADRSAESMQRLRDPFRTAAERDNGATMPGAAR